jgi:hypothetical protein
MTCNPPTDAAPGNAERVRAYIKALGPNISHAALARALGWTNEYLGDQVRKLVRRGDVTKDLHRCYTYVREPSRPGPVSTSPIPYKERERERLRLRQKRKGPKVPRPPKQTREERLAKQREYEAKRRDARNAARRAATGRPRRAVNFDLHANKAARSRDYATRTQENAEIAQRINRRDLGLRDMPEAPVLETVAEWMARTGNAPEVLTPGKVGPLSQFNRLENVA